MTNINTSVIFNDFLSNRTEIQVHTHPVGTVPVRSKKKINKALIGGTAAICIAAITAAGIALVRKKSVPIENRNILKSFDEVFSRANTAVEEVKNIQDGVILVAIDDVKKTRDEILSFFEKGSKNGYQDVVRENGILVRKFELENGVPKKMLEYGEDGASVIRETEIESLKEKIFSVYDRIHHKVFDFIGGEVINYEESYEELAEGSKKIVKRLSFLEGKQLCYDEGYEELADGSRKVAKWIWFENGVPKFYEEGHEELADGSRNVAKWILYRDGSPEVYEEGSEELSCGSRKVAKWIWFEGGIPKFYGEGRERLADGSWKTAKRILFLKEGSSRKVKESYKILAY